MAEPTVPNEQSEEAEASSSPSAVPAAPKKHSRFGTIFSKRAPSLNRTESTNSSTMDPEKNATKERPPRWTLGILNDKETDEVPGSILLMAGAAKYNEPLGLHHAQARTSASSLPSPYPPSPGSHRSHTPSIRSHSSRVEEIKRTKDGAIILEPQPEDSTNDPLNWSKWRRDAALLSIGFFSMVGGGMTPVLAAGFNNVAATFHTTEPRVALTTGLYMMGLGVGNVIMSPTAILFGKRPVYLMGATLFILASVWCALSPSYDSLVVARVVQGIAVSPVECLPSASIAEIFFLHERAYRLGIYTLLLLGGKNLIPLVSAAVIESLGWRWVFWVVAIIVGFAGALMFLFVPESFWDRTPLPKKKSKHGHWNMHRPFSLNRIKSGDVTTASGALGGERRKSTDPLDGTIAHRRLNRHVGFAEPAEKKSEEQEPAEKNSPVTEAEKHDQATGAAKEEKEQAADIDVSPHKLTQSISFAEPETNISEKGDKDPNVRDSEPGYFDSVINAHGSQSYEMGQFSSHEVTGDQTASLRSIRPPRPVPTRQHSAGSVSIQSANFPETPMHYTKYYRAAPPKTYLQTLKLYSGRLSHDNWFKVAFRPFILYAYPSVLWSAMLYSLSVGWLIVLSESATTIFKVEYYHFTAIQTGLIYVSPFVGGILGTAVAGKVSDFMVRRMAKRNEGVYEPEFRLLMAAPVALATVVGLMGFGWAAQVRDAWIVPTLFFGLISFGCTLGSTTAITFTVDSYRQYAGEALVTLNFSKNIFHGLVFSLFFNRWLDADGARRVFLALGGIQLGLLLFTIPMYIYGKRSRMWTVRKNLMEKF